MALALLLFAVVVAVHRGAFEQPDLKLAVLLTALPLVLLPSALGGQLRRAANQALPRPLLALAGLLAWFAFRAAPGGLDVVELKPIAVLLAGSIVSVLAWATSFERPRVLPTAMLWCGLLAAALAILQAAGIDPVFGERADSERQAVSFFDNTNRAGEFLAPLLVLAVAAARARPLRWLALVSIAPLAAALVLTQSRGAALAAVVGLLVAWVLEKRDADYGGNAPQRLVPNALLAAGVGLALLVGGLDVLGFKAVGTATESIASPEYPTNKQRLALMSSTVDMVKDAPFLGHGPGRFARDFPPYRDRDEARIPTLLGARSVAEDPHDQYLLLLAEGGIPALLLFLAFVLPALLAARSAVVIGADDPRRAIAHANGAALAALLVLALFRSILANPPVALVLFLLCGQLLPLRDDLGHAKRPTVMDRFLPLVLVGMLALGGSLLGAQLALAGVRNTIEEVTATGKTVALVGADRSLARAEALDPSDLNVKQVRSVVLETITKLESGLEQTAARAEHERLLRRTLALRPWHVPALVGLAALHLERAELDSARRLLAHALHADAGRGRAPRYDPRAAAALLVNLRHEDAAGRLFALEAEDGAIPKDLPLAIATDSGTSPALVLALLETMTPGDPRHGDTAYAAGLRAQAAGQTAIEQRLFQRAHLSIALEHLQNRKFDDAARSAKLARRNLPSDAAEIVEALAEYAQGRGVGLEQVLRTPRQLDAKFRAALERLEAMDELSAGIATVLARP